MKALCFVVISCWVLFSACDLFKNEQVLLSDEFVPLSVGNYWDYHRWYLSPDIADTVREEIIEAHAITFNGDTVTAYGYQQFFQRSAEKAKYADLIRTPVSKLYIPSAQLKAHSEPEYQWLRANKPDGLYSFGGISPTDTLVLQSLQYKHPASSGDEVSYPVLSYSFSELQFSLQDTITIEIMGTNETFKSEWATFRGCYVYRFQEVGKGDAVYVWDHYVFIKPGIGIVAVETIQLTSDITNYIVGQWILVGRQINN